MVVALAVFALIVFGIIASGLILGAIVLQTRNSTPRSPTLATALKMWKIGAGIAVGASALLFAFFSTQAANQPPGPCSISKAPSSSPPGALVTAQDYFAQGDYDFDRGNCTQAIADYTRALELKPDFAEAYNNRAFTYMAEQNYSPALPDLDRAIALRPDYVNALMNRGDIYNYYYQIDYARAIADYNRILELGPAVYTHTSLCGHLAMAHHSGNLIGAFAELLIPTQSAAACLHSAD